MIEKPGIYALSEGDYHKDPVIEPSLSSSIAETIIEKSPRHAWWSHPRLNPDFRVEYDDKFDLGSAAHAYILEGTSAFECIVADDWRTKAAKDARDAARLAGKIPILKYRFDDVLAMADTLERQLDVFTEQPRPFRNGKPEQTLVWQDRGRFGDEAPIWCRIRVDWLHDDYRTADDLKSTAASAHPESWSRTMFGMGGDVQAAFYLRGIKAVTGVDATWRFVVIENYAPFVAAVIGLDPMVLSLAEKKVDLAMELWRKCITTGKWPGYETRTCYATLPPYIEAAWIAREER